MSERRKNIEALCLSNLMQQHGRIARKVGMAPELGAWGDLVGVGAKAQGETDAQFKQRILAARVGATATQVRQEEHELRRTIFTHIGNLQYPAEFLYLGDREYRMLSREGAIDCRFHTLGEAFGLKVLPVPMQSHVGVS